jgi:hypothetical protein
LHFLRFTDPLRPLDKIRKQLTDKIFRALVGQISLLVEFIACVADHHFRLVYGEHVKKDHHLPKVVLRRAVAIPPTDAPMMAAGFPAHALSP